MTIDEDEPPQHVDGYLAWYANHTTVLLACYPESHIVKRIHHAYVDEYNVRTLENEKLTPNSVILQDMPVSVLDSKWELDPTKVKLVTSHLQETRERLDPDKCVTTTISLTPADEQFGLHLETDHVYGFPILNRITPTFPLRTQISMNVQRNC